MDEVARTPAASNVTLTQLMGTLDSNNLGNVHGGVLMKLCDEAGGMSAARHARRICVTVAVDRMSFNAPVHLGSLVTFSAHVTWVGRTSIETEVVVKAENVLTGKITHTNTAYFLYVALGPDGTPIEVPPLVLETADDERRHALAAERQQRRLEVRRREKGEQP